MAKALEATIADRIAEFDRIPADRRRELDTFADMVRQARQGDRPARLVFICTHNSRRSHMCQIWAAVAAYHYGVSGIHTYSGGTESTAFNPRAVAAMERAGLRIARTTDDDNPIYHVRYSDDAHPLTCFSKVYDHAPNPKKDFIAVMNCDHANEACPIVRGASKRVALMYEDPKVADGTPEEAAKYDERCRQIGREMLYVFSRLK
ncbi:MAG TPA: protein-tyrosine-phosphatase [Phycisphaerae bacterium]|nr:protein-tyrosine-phosphatase [Phycisphaerae bacterium]HRW55392.1 protein-tyrosine-phosphatase [Phycisphaerae bacterium]